MTTQPATLTQGELTRLADDALAANDLELIRAAIAAMKGDPDAMARCVLEARGAPLSSGHA
jgi:hypothetical protein